MRLINYGVGEILDRLTILDLKLAHGGGEHFATERAALLDTVRGREITWPIAERIIALMRVNGELWRAEDQLRSLRQQPGGEWEMIASNLAFGIQELNDQRSALVEAINQLTGDHVGSEKLRG